MKPPTNYSARVAAGVSEPQSEAKRAKHSTDRSAAREQFRKAKRAYDAAIIVRPVILTLKSPATRRCAD